MPPTQRLPRFHEGQNVFHKADGSMGAIVGVKELLGSRRCFAYDVSWGSDTRPREVVEHLLAASMAELSEEAFEVDETGAEGDEA
jgi:hypothetical protein